MDIKSQARTALRRFRVLPPTPSVKEPMGLTDLMQQGARFPILQHRAVPVNPYKPNVQRGDFPEVPTPMTRWIPPSIQPQMIIRQGATPNPTGAIHTPGPVKVKR